MTDLSAEEKLARIRSLLGLETEEEADAQQSDELEEQIDVDLDTSTSAQSQEQEEERGTPTEGTAEQIPSPSDLPDGGELILSAFQQARASGKLDWYQMTTATLKSRILSLTDRTFAEDDYGVGTLTEFIQRYSDLVSLDTSLPHPMVKLLNRGQDPVGDGSFPSTSRAVRIRGDLWRAVLDRSSGESYYWNPDTAQVKTGQPLDWDLVLPSVDESTDHKWRQDFIDSIVGEVEVAASDNHQLVSWSNNLLPTYRLPSHLIPRWNRFLTGQVVTLLSDWFERSKMEPPRDFYSTGVSRAHRTNTETERLRQLVLAVVQEMTAQELSNLILPPRAVLRATRSRRHG